MNQNGKQKATLFINYAFEIALFSLFDEFKMHQLCQFITIRTHIT